MGQHVILKDSVGDWEVLDKEPRFPPDGSVHPQWGGDDELYDPKWLCDGDPRWVRDPFTAIPLENQIDNRSQSLPGKPASDLNFEADRLATFEKWSIPFIDKDELAMLGFHYVGPCDNVRCHFCKVQIYMWVEGDNVLDDHVKWSPKCKFICGEETENVPLNEERLKEALNALPSKDVHGGMERSTTVSEGSIEKLCAEDIHMYQHHQPSESYDIILRGSLNMRPRCNVCGDKHN